MLAAMAVALLGCRPDRSRASRVDRSELAGRSARLDDLKARSDTTGDRNAPLARWILPDNLAEISGLALTADGRLLAHDDERGMISEINYRSGIVTKQFLLGRRGVQSDFEGIAVAGRQIFLLTSTGKLYEFLEGANDARVTYSVHDTDLGHECEFEGLAYDPAINALLLACKNVGEKKLRDHVVIYRWALDPQAKPRLSHIAIPLSSLIEGQEWTDLHPSGIEVDPLTGNYVLVAAQEKALLMVTPDGRPVWARPLPGTHDQAEGIALTRDSILIIADEAGRRPSAVTLYRWP